MLEISMSMNISSKKRWYTVISKYDYWSSEKTGNSITLLPCSQSVLSQH